MSETLDRPYQVQVVELQQALAEKDRELKLNASMLAKQCDLAREAETKQATAERKVKELEEGISEFNSWLIGPAGVRNIKDIPDEIYEPFRKLIDEG